MPTKMTAVVPLAGVTVRPRPSGSTRAILPQETTFSAEYSVAKFLALHAYVAHTSPWRVLCVLVAMPLPALLGSSLPLLVPLQNPTLGFEANRCLVLHGSIIIFLVSCGVVLLTLGATSTPRHVYPVTNLLAVALSTTCVLCAFNYVLLSQWRFPAPFFILFVAPVWILAVNLSHKIVLRDQIKRYPRLMDSLSRYRVPLVLQTGQVGIYAGLTVLFDKVTTTYQVALIVLFPVVKFVLKRVLYHHTSALGEMAAEVTISIVEICASLYQATIMQSAQSTLALCAIMGVDVVQGFVSIKFFMGRDSKTPRKLVFSRALQILERHRAAPLVKSPVQIANLNADEAVVVSEALALAAAADRILLVEYFEVSVPIVAALFLLLSFRSTSTLYNTRLYRFYDNAELVTTATQSVLLYSLLQGASVVVFYGVLRWRYNMSALYHLAFVLEYHMRSIQGKLLVFFPIIFYFALIHYGTDFTLRFDFEKLMRGMVVP